MMVAASSSGSTAAASSDAGTRQRGASAGGRPLMSRQRARASSGDMENQPRAANSMLMLPTCTRSAVSAAGKPPLGPHRSSAGNPAGARVVKRARSLSLPLEWDEASRFNASSSSTSTLPAVAASASSPSSSMPVISASSSSSRQTAGGSLRDTILLAPRSSAAQPTAVAAAPEVGSPSACCAPTASSSSAPVVPPDAVAPPSARAAAGSQCTASAACSNEPQPCIICYSGFSAKRPPVLIPCAAKCNDAPVHAKCIFEWKETKRPFTMSPSSCPLCRGPLAEMDYTPPDPLHTQRLSSFAYRKSFVSRPLPRAAGMVRCYIRAVREDSVLFGKTIRYEMYLQAPPKVRYPHGDLPTSSSPVVGDVLLMVARKRTLKQGACFNSIVDMSLDTSGQDFDRKGANFVGCIKSSFSGLEHTVLAPFSTQPSAAAEAEASSADASGGKTGRSRHRRRGPHHHHAGSQGLSFLELGSVRYTQNRVGRSVGPRRMQVCVPMVGAAAASALSGDADEDHIDLEEEAAAAKSVAATLSGPEATSSPASPFAHMNVLQEDDDEDEESERERPWATNVYRPLKSGETMRQMLRRGQSSVASSQRLLYGTNKQPYWLEAIQAYSLDFAGRVTLPSNKNFQLCLQGEAAAGSTIPDSDGTNEITLQFGKVHEGAVEVYTLDVQWPLSPVQAFGICLTASIQKVCCA